MSQYLPESRDIILAYLHREFPNFAIQEEKDDESYCFRLKDDNASYFVRVMFTAIESHDSEALTAQLERLTVAETMRGLGDFPVVVTECGCMFGSP